MATTIRIRLPGHAVSLTQSFDCYLDAVREVRKHWPSAVASSFPRDGRCAVWKDRESSDAPDAAYRAIGFITV